MDDATIRKRLDAALLLLVGNFLLLSAFGLSYAPETTVGALALVALLAIGHARSDRVP
jgi:hypothetical protein